MVLETIDIDRIAQTWLGSADDFPNYKKIYISRQTIDTLRMLQDVQIALAKDERILFLLSGRYRIYLNRWVQGFIISARLTMNGPSR